MSTLGGGFATRCAAVALAAAIPAVMVTLPAAEASRRDRSTTTWIDATRGYSIIAESDGLIEFLVVDRAQGRVDPADFPQREPWPVLTERVTPVTLRFDPATADSRRPALVTGFYHDSYAVQSCDEPRVGAVLVCIGFSQAESDWLFDPDRYDDPYVDMPNMVREVTSVLDVLTSGADVFPRVDQRRIVYAGVSLGAMVGYLMMHPTYRDPRIRAVVARLGFAPDWIPALGDPSTWASAPPFLMVNVFRDELVPYSGARRTFRLARPFGRMTLLTVNGSAHRVRCAPAVAFEDAWIDVRLGLRPHADDARSEVVASTCSSFGLRRGGSEGDGTFGFLRP